MCVCTHISYKLLPCLQILHSQNKTASDTRQDRLNDHSLVLRAAARTALGLAGEALCEARERTCIQVPPPWGGGGVGTLEGTHSKLLDLTHPEGAGPVESVLSACLRPCLGLFLCFFFSGNTRYQKHHLALPGPLNSGKRSIEVVELIHLPQPAGVLPESSVTKVICKSNL